MNLSEAANINQPAPIFTENSFELLKNYRWPGNVRELKNFVKRMIILRPGEKIHLHDVEKIMDMDPRPDTLDENGLPTLAESDCHFI